MEIDAEGLLAKIKLDPTNLNLYALVLSMRGLVDAHLQRDEETLRLELDSWGDIFADYYLNGDHKKYRDIIHTFMYAVVLLVKGDDNITFEDWRDSYKSV